MARHDYGEQAGEALEILPKNFDERLRLACLKVGAGSVSQLRVAVNEAGIDFREVIVSAEYERQMRNRTPEAQLADEQEYRKWLAPALEK